METHTQAVAGHYDQDDIAGAIRAALQRAGKDLDALTIDDLAPADEVHTRGRKATEEVASLTTFAPEMEVVDVGSGVGGPARYLAQTFGCRVTGIDLTPVFSAAANALTELVGLADRVRFETGSALEMPFDGGRFDRAWTVQMQMNIADKPRLYGEIHRVLKPGGRLVFQDIVEGPGGPLILPVPWASEAGHSHLVPAGALRAAVLDAGFKEVLWRDISEAQRDWTRRQGEKPKPETPPEVDIHLVLGPDTTLKRANSSQCLMEDRIGFVQGVFEKVLG
ncbi:MAG: methyltransferase domain-containing protein [Hyphomicrobiales bacterium]|nr:methyltransferase domain-containing protein [Hyphomicrobiales bacterium]